MSYEIIEPELSQPKISVIGIGGGGGNAISNMISSGMTGVDFIVVNTDAQDLERSLAPTRYQLGESLTRGLGAGSKPDIGREAAIDDKEALTELIVGNDMIFITAGMGGGTGTGAAPVIAQIAKDLGILTVGVVTRPFQFEGRRRKIAADEGLKALHGSVDTLITIPNERLINISNQHTSFLEAFKMVDQVLCNAVRGISDVIQSRGYMNVDFADIRTIMQGKGVGLMGEGVGKGKRGLVDAVQQAINSPLLDERSISGAKSILLNITASANIPLHIFSEASNIIAEEAHEEANITTGFVTDETIGDEVRVTVIATEFENKEKQQQSVERRVVNSVSPQNYGQQPRRTARKQPPLVSGLRADDFDLPTYRR